jgi:hypothetical protein
MRLSAARREDVDEGEDRDVDDDEEDDVGAEDVEAF